VYNYFADYYGTNEADNIASKAYDLQYASLSVNNLKKSLRDLKDASADLQEIRYVCRLVRTKISKHVNKPQNKDQEMELKNNF